MGKRLVRVGFGCYCLLMLWLLFGQRIAGWSGMDYWEQVQGNLNLMPFRTIRNYIHVGLRITNGPLFRHIVINLLGNVVMFVPLGFFLPGVFPSFRSFRRCIVRACLIIVGIELVQLFTLLGSLDVDDLILNGISAAMGYGIWSWIGANFGKK